MKHIKLFENFDAEDAPEESTPDMTGTHGVKSLVAAMCNVSEEAVLKHVKENAMFDDEPFADLEVPDQQAIEELISKNEECEFVLSTEVHDLLVYINALRMNLEVKGEAGELISKWEALKAEHAS